MKTAFLIGLACLLAPSLGAATLQDWTTLEPQKNIGVWADAAGSTLDFHQAEGPSHGQKALSMESTVVQWAGIWATVQGGLGSGESLRFRAKSDKAVQVNVILADSQERPVVHAVRLSGGAWESFNLPANCFVKPDWANPQSAAGSFDLTRLASVSFGPTGSGESVVTLGPLESSPSATLRDGGMARGVAQDFIALPSSAYGPYADALGSKIAMAVKKGAPAGAGSAACVDYDQKTGGWCGEWIRAGSDWKGQNWSKAKGLRVEIYSADTLKLQLAFNDSNQNAYLSEVRPVEPGAWRSVDFPIRSFSLNPYYQPAQAKKGAPLDLSNVESFNITPMSAGSHRFWVRMVRLDL